MRRRWGAAAVAVVALAAAGCTSSGGGGEAGGEAAGGLTATPSPDCAPDQGLYDGLRAYLAREAADAAWIDRVAVCAGGTIEVDQGSLDDEASRAEAIEVCEVAAGYLLTNPPPPERADAPNPKELGVIVADAEGNPIVLGAEEEAPAGGDEAEHEAREREEREREEREAAAEGEDADRGSEREAEPHRCFAPFA